MTGLSTVLVTVSPQASLQAGPPRLLRPTGFFLGNCLGGPFQDDLQRRVIKDALLLLKTPMEPGTLVEKDYPDYRPGKVPPVLAD